MSLVLATRSCNLWFVDEKDKKSIQTFLYRSDFRDFLSLFGKKLKNTCGFLRTGEEFGFPFWAAAPEGLMTYNSTQGNFVLGGMILGLRGLIWGP